MTAVSPAAPGSRPSIPDPVDAVLGDDAIVHPAEPGGTHFQPHLPRRFALDGIRGLAVLAVVLYHLDVSWMTGGFLGVSLFFTLSGFLITNLVLAEESKTGGLALGSFWARRGRRLLPAMFVTLAVAVVFGYLAADADQLRRLPGDVWSSLGYVTNWRFIVAGDAYGAGYQEPSPLAHFWSLAIEEQFYLVFPLVAALLVRRGATRRAWFAVFGAVLVASMAATLVLYDRSDTARTYFGTDTRMAELVAGVLLAVAVRMELPDRIRRLPGRWALAAVPLVASVVLWVVVDLSDQWLYQGGLWLVALVSCGLILAALDHGPVSAVLSVRPLVWLGLLSYGIYLYHWPIFRWLDETSTGLDGVALAALRLAVTSGAAVASYVLVEKPIRTRRVDLPGPVIAVALPLSAVVLSLAAWQVAGDADERAVGDASDLAILADPAPGGTPTVTAPPTTAPLPPVERILFMGDSLVHQAYPSFEAHFAEQGIETMAVGGPGQTLLEHSDEWLTELSDAVTTFDPDVVVLEACCGYGDLIDRREWVTDDGEVLALDSPEIWAEWRSVAAEATEIAASGGAVPLWVLAPPAQTNGFYGPIEGRIPVANELYRDLATCEETIGLVDWSVVSDDGEYTDTLPDADGNPVQVRVADGLHFTPEGGDLLSRLTDQAMTTWWATTGGRLAPADRPAAADCG